MPDGPGRYPVPDDLDDRGRQLWVEFGASRESDPGSRLLIHEACRIADDLERLHRIVRGDADEWMRFTVPRGGDGEELVLRIDGVMAERRLLVTTLRQLLDKLRRIRTAPTAEEDPAGEQTEQGGGDIVDEVARARAARRAEAANL